MEEGSLRSPPTFVIGGLQRIAIHQREQAFRSPHHPGPTVSGGITTPSHDGPEFVNKSRQNHTSPLRQNKSCPRDSVSQGLIWANGLNRGQEHALCGSEIRRATESTATPQEPNAPISVSCPARQFILSRPNIAGRSGAKDREISLNDFRTQPRILLLVHPRSHNIWHLLCSVAISQMLVARGEPVSSLAASRCCT